MLPSGTDCTPRLVKEMNCSPTVPQMGFARLLQLPLIVLYLESGSVHVGV